jgi:DNA-binding NtrC family response regulator
MLRAVLSISEERVIGPIRNTVLAHAGYGVIPASTAKSALKILSRRHVCAMVIAKSVSPEDQQLLCSEGRKRGVASLILDPYGHLNSGPEVHFNPLDGPEAFLRVLEAVMLRDHRRCVG